MGASPAELANTAAIEHYKALVGAIATVCAALIVAGGGTMGAALVSRGMQKRRNEQDRESQWRTHAVELTKLDAERLMKSRSNGRVRPFILTFLANYRDLTELGSSTPAELYKKILEKRINRPADPISTLLSDQERVTVTCPTEDVGDHPRVFLEVTQGRVTTCPYCSHSFSLARPSIQELQSAADG